MSLTIHLLLPVLALSCAAKPPPAIEKLRLEVTPDQVKLPAGGHVRVRCSIINDGSQPVTLPLMFVPELHFIRFEIVGPDGKRRPFAGPERKIGLTSGVLRTLAPGMFAGMTLDLSGTEADGPWYSFAMKGNYTVQATYTVTKERLPAEWTNVWTGELRSQPVSIVVQ